MYIYGILMKCGYLLQAEISFKNEAIILCYTYNTFGQNRLHVLKLN